MRTAPSQPGHSLSIRPCGPQDLPSVNRIIDAGIDSWQLSERVKRLSKPLYHYGPDDLAHLDIHLAVAGGEAVGIIAWEPLEPAMRPDGLTGWLLHGLFVRPEAAGRGIGRALVAACSTAARAAGVDGLLVKAQADAEGFFQSLGFQRLPVISESRDYDLRYWLSLTRQTADQQRCRP